MIPNVLSIAGSDPSGGAGIQADLKTFSALGCYGMAAVTSLTAQNTKGVSGVFNVPPEFVAKQIASVFDDIRVDAVKIGMAGSAETVDAIAEMLTKYKPAHIVLDPVITAQSGEKLISYAAVKALKEKLLKLASVITPNIPEAAALLGHAIDDRQQAAQEFISNGVRAVLLKGGHDEGPICFDVLADAGGVVVMEAPRIQTKNNHGTGCTLSAAIAAELAKGMEMEEACRAAKTYINGALQAANDLSVGHGAGPVWHFWNKA